MVDELVMYNVKDIQRIFNCGINQAYQIVNASGFPSIRVGGKILTEKNALEKWVLKNQGNKIIIR